MDEQDEEIVWANIHYGRGVPIPVETTAVSKRAGLVRVLVFNIG